MKNMYTVETKVRTGNVATIGEPMSKAMTTEEAYRHWEACKEAHGKQDPNVTMVRDSWTNGYTVQYTCKGRCTVARTVSCEVATFCGKWH